MQNVLPQQAGLEVTGIIYRYTAVKDPESDMIVYVQNEDAQNEGQYIFRQQDDWSQKPGNTIFKLIPQNNVLIDRWGDGSIQVEGEGEVQDALVTYDYRYDPCFDPQSDPSCPGYVPPIPDIPEPDLTDYYAEVDRALEEDAKNKELKENDEDEEERNRRRSKIKEKNRLEIALGGINSALLTADAAAKHAELMSLSIIPETYTVQTIPVITYEETIVLDGGELPDNKQGKRLNFAQQALHEKMVDLQYEKK